MSKTTDKSINNLVKFFLEIGTLRKISRSHKQLLMSCDHSDNISSHLFRTAIIGYMLAKLENANAGKVLLMCLLHDTAEARCGDQNWVNKKYVKVFEEEIFSDQLKDLPDGEEILKIVKEYEKRESKEAMISKDADLLEQLFLLREYEESGNKQASKWLRPGKRLKSEQEKILTTESAKRIAKKIRESDIDCWWKDVWTSKRR